MEGNGPKDHTPGTFRRKSGYESDLENMEKMGKRVNTSFGSANHNAYIHMKDGGHMHFWYDPAGLKCGYHGENYATRNNHPKTVQDQVRKGENVMKDRDTFLQSIKASEEVQEKTRAVIAEHQKQAKQGKPKTTEKGSGREIGNESRGKGSEGREAGLKAGHDASKGSHAVMTGCKTAAGVSAGKVTGGKGTGGKGNGISAGKGVSGGKGSAGIGSAGKGGSKGGGKGAGL